MLTIISKCLIMNIKYIFLVLATLFTLVSCEDSDEDSPTRLELSQSSFSNISSKGDTVEVNVTCNSTWTTSTTAPWCTVTPHKGNGNQKISLHLLPNLEETARTVTVTVSAQDISQTIQLNQEGGNISPEDYHYNLPVIFHVLYKDKTAPLQYVSAKRLSDILDKVNKLYKGTGNNVDMSLTFTLAETNPDGETLPDPGVEYVQWTESYPIDCNTFMQDDSKKYVKFIWDPNRYINVMVYNFTTDESNSTILGISHLPFSTKGNTFLEGLSSVEYTYLSLSNLRFPYCASINSLYINAQSTENLYNSADITVTVAHELGHYLGLHHVFYEGTEDNMDGCEDTDYCEDTPSYNKYEYDADYIWAVSGNVPEDNLYSYLVKRTNCSNIQFISYNIMDYAVSYSNQFTQDQRNRIRHVLTYSPLIPGPKKGQSNSRMIHDEALDLPIRVIK